MVLLGLVFAFQGSVLEDPRLKSLTDFDISLQQITDFCSEVSASTGVTLSVSKGVQDLKVDVFVDKKPLAETLDKVAKVLNCEWVPNGKGYRLEMSPANENRERNFVQAEENEDRDKLKLVIWAHEYVAKNSPYLEKGQYELTEFMKQSARLQEPFYAEINDAEKSKDTLKMELAISRLQAVTRSTSDLTFGRAVSQFQGEDITKFWNGELFLASSFPDSKLKLFHSDSRGSGRSFSTGPNNESIEADYEEFAAFRFDPILKRVQMNEMSFRLFPLNSLSKGSISASHGNGGFVFLENPRDIPEKLKSMPFYLDLKPWMDAKLTAKAFDQSIDEKTKDWVSPWFDGQRRLGDHLRWEHRASGVPIVAQADRSCLYEWKDLNRGMAKFSDFISKLGDETKSLVKDDDGYLLARPYRYWNHRKHEVPELVWNKFRNSESSSSLRLNDYISLVKQVRLDQIRSTELGYPVSNFDCASTAQCYESLKLFGTLNSNQQALAASKEGLPWAQMGGTQQVQFRKAILNLIVETGIISYDLAKTLMRSGIDDGQIQTFRLLVEQQDEKQGASILRGPNGKQEIVKPTNYNFVSFNYQMSPKESVNEWIRLKQ